MNPEVSVVIPTYNRSKTILKSISSVLNQTFTNFELIIIDDGSTDDTEAIVNNINDFRIHYIKTENKGVSNARNTGANISTGTWIAFHDSDDIWHEDKLEKQILYSALHPEYNLIYCGYRGYRNDGFISTTPDRDSGNKLSGYIFPSLLKRNSIGAPTILIRRNTFLDSGGFDTNISCLEDWDFALNISKHHTIGFIDEDLLDVELHEGGVSTHISNYFTARCYILRKYKNDFIEHNLLVHHLADIMSRATQLGIADPIEKMLNAYLT